MGDDGQDDGRWHASDRQSDPPGRSLGPDDEVWAPPATRSQPPPSRPAWHPDPHDPAHYRYWDGSAWTKHTAARHATPLASRRRTRSGTVSVWCAIGGGVLTVGGFAAAVGTRPPDPGEEDTYALVIGGLLTAMLIGFLLQVVALAVGVIGLWRLGPNERDERLSTAIGISAPLVAVGIAVIALIAAINA